MWTSTWAAQSTSSAPSNFFSLPFHSNPGSTSPTVSASLCLPQQHNMGTHQSLSGAIPPDSSKFTEHISGQRLPLSWRETDACCCRGAGSALMQKPLRMEQIVRGMSRTLTCPLTIKVRRGYCDGGDVAHLYLPRAATWGAAAATLHGRSREQRFATNFNYVSKLQDLSTAPLVYPAVEMSPEILRVCGNGFCFSDCLFMFHLASTEGAVGTAHQNEERWDAGSSMGRQLQQHATRMPLRPPMHGVLNPER